MNKKIVIEEEELKKKSIDVISSLNGLDVARAYFLLEDRFCSSNRHYNSSDINLTEVSDQDPNADEIMEEYINYLKSSGRSEKTVKVYLSEAKKFLSCTQSANITFTDINLKVIFKYLSKAKESRHLSQNSYSRLMIALKCFLLFLYKNEIVKIDLYSDLKIPKKVDKKREVLTDDDIKKVENYLENRVEKFSGENIRDQIIFYLGIKCGLRKSEMIKLNWENIDLDECIIKVINSKGGKDRVVYFNGDLKKLLVNYRKVKGKYISAVIRGKNGKRICSNTLQEAIRRMYKESGIYRSGLTIHSLRHTYAESLRKNSIDLPTIQALLGHKSLEATAKYLHVTKDDLKKAVCE